MFPVFAIVAVAISAHSIPSLKISTLYCPNTTKHSFTHLFPSSSFLFFFIQTMNPRHCSVIVLGGSPDEIDLLSEAYGDGNQMSPIPTCGNCYSKAPL